MKSYVFLIPCFAFLFSCSEQETMLFRDKHEIYFNKFYVNAMYPGTQEADSTVFSFFFDPVTELNTEAQVVVNLSGVLPESDLKFQLKVIEEETTANPDEYTIDEYYVFHAHNVGEDAKEALDTIAIKLHRSTRLENMPDGVRLVVELVPNEEVGLGQVERRRAKIIMTNLTAEPDWWTKEVERYLLGIYSPEKYRTFLDHVEGGNQLDGDLIKNRPDEAKKLALEFKKWLNEQNPAVREKDGSLMVVAI